MLNTSHISTAKFDGKYEKIPKVWKALESRLQGTNIKNVAIAEYPISLHGVFIMGLMSNCPDKSVDFQNGWTMEAICNQNDIDRPSPNNALYREILEAFETNAISVMSSPF